MTHWWSGRSGISILILGYLLLGANFTASVPPWEAPDEPWHLVYAEALSSGRLPSEDETYEHHHPPLYYLWPALTLRAAGLTSIPRSVDNFRYPFAAAAYLHPEDEAAKASMRLLRTLSGMLGTISVALTWALARLAARGSRRRCAIAFSAASIVAVIPQFGFIAHSISNDTLATVWGAWLAYWGLRWIRCCASQDPTRESGRLPGLQRERLVIAIALGLGAGLGLLTKLNLLALWPAIGVAWALGALILFIRANAEARQAGLPPRIGWSGIVRAVAPAAILIPLLAMGLVYLASQIWPSIGVNLQSTLLDRGAAREDLSGVAYLFDQGKRMIDSLWGRYGWFNLRPPLLQRQLMSLFALLALLGLPLAFKRSEAVGRASMLYALSICALALAAGLRNLMVDPQPQARLLFPALPAFALLVAWGANALPIKMGGRRSPDAFLERPTILALALVLGLLGTNVYATQSLLPTAYKASRIAPPMLDMRMLPPAWKIAAKLEGDGAVATQTFVANEAGLRGIEVPVIVANGEGKLVARLYAGDPETIKSTQAALGETQVPLSELGRPQVDVEVLGPLADTSWIRVEHEALPDSAGQTFTLMLQIEGEGQAWLWGARSGSDYNLGRLMVNGEEETDLVFTTLR